MLGGHLQRTPAVRWRDVRLQGALQARPAGGSCSAGGHRFTACEQPYTYAGITDLTWALTIEQQYIRSLCARH